MAEDVAELLQEISGILRRISEQNETKGHAAEKEPEFREPPLHALQKHKQLLESLIERLQGRSKKG